MWTCPKCKIDVEPSFELCWSCGTSRDGEETPGFDPEAEGVMGAKDYEAETEAKRREVFITLATFWSAPEAHVLRSRLAAEGIAATVSEDLATGGFNNSACAKVEVPQAQVEAAKEIMVSLQQVARPEERLIAKTVKEGIQIEPSPAVELAAEDEERQPRETPDRLVRYAFRAMLLGFIAPCFPFHVVSLYLLIRSTRLPGELSPKLQSRFVVTFIVDVIITVLFWFPVALTLIFFALRFVLSLL